MAAIMRRYGSGLFRISLDGSGSHGFDLGRMDPARAGDEVGCRRRCCALVYPLCWCRSCLEWSRGVGACEASIMVVVLGFFFREDEDLLDVGPLRSGWGVGFRKAPPAISHGLLCLEIAGSGGIRLQHKERREALLLLPPWANPW